MSRQVETQPFDESYRTIFNNDAVTPIGCSHRQQTRLEEQQSIHQPSKKGTIWKRIIIIAREKRSCFSRTITQIKFLRLHSLYNRLRSAATMKYLPTLLLSLVPGVLCHKAPCHKKRIGSSSDPKPPFPFTPPSEAFCKSNILGDDAYLSFFTPCDFAFYKTDLVPDHFSCDEVDPSVLIKTESRKVMMWPESCVAVGPRCYSLVDYPDLFKFAINSDEENYAMEFPSDATVVSVDCTADFAKVEVFMESLGPEIEHVASSIAFASGVVLFAVVAAIVACFCCCFGACKARPNYTLVPGSVMSTSTHFEPPSKTKVLV